MAPPTRGPTDDSAGVGANILEGPSSRGAAFGGGDLISFAPNNPDDAAGVKLYGRFGRRFTNNAVWFESPNKMFQFHVGGRTQMDAAFFSTSKAVQFGPGGIGTLADGVAPRRMRVRLEGAMYETMLFAMEFDFINSAVPLDRSGSRSTSPGNTPAAGDPVPIDLWVTFRNIPVIGNIRVGNQKDPMGFERLESGRFLNFMERSFNQDAFYGPFNNGFNPGIATFSTCADRMGTYASSLSLIDNDRRLTGCTIQPPSSSTRAARNRLSGSCRASSSAC